MAKRLFALLLVFVLLLTGCSKKPEPAPTPSESVSVPGTTEAPPTTTESAPPLNFAHSTTAGGVQVHTDTSQYSAYTPPEHKYTRLSEEPLTEFHPGNYGLLLPYAASPLYGKNEMGYSWLMAYQCGMMTRDGCIVTDGIYTKISPMSIYRYYDGETATYTYLPLWLVSRVNQVETINVESEWGDYSYIDGHESYGVIAMDGSFAIPCEYWDVQAFEDCFLCSRGWQSPDFVIFDLQGKPILFSSQLFDKPCDWWSVDYGEGLYTVNFGYENRTNESWFVDKTGNRVLGPYASAEPFSEGLACVSLDGENHGYIDRNGNWVIDAKYRFGASFRDDRVIQEQGRDYVLLDNKGNELIRVDEDGYLSLDSSGLYRYGNWNTRDYRFYDRDGKLIFHDDGEWDCLDARTLLKQEENRVTIHSLDDPDNDLVVRGVSYMNPAVVWLDGKLVEGYRGTDYSGGRSVFVPKDRSTVYETKFDPENGYPADYNYSLTDPITGELYWVISDATTTRLVTADGKLVHEFRGGTAQSRNLSVFDGLIRDVNGDGCTFLTHDGEIVFSMPFLASD